MNLWRTRAVIAVLTMTLAMTLMMALTIALAPAVLLAAPAVQATGPAVIGFYQSEVIPTGDDSGLQISLTLYEDGSAEAVSDLLTDEPPIVEVGTWEQNDDGSVTLTLNGTETESYAEPVVLVFELDEDGALSIPGVEGGAFGSEGLTLAPAEPPTPETTAEATETPAEAEATPAATEEPAEEQADQTEEIQVYLSDLLPVATGPGRQITLTVNVDGTAEMVTDLMNGEAPVVESGEWARSSGVLTVTLTANADGDYAEPVVYAFQEEEDGSLLLPGEEGGPFGAEGLTLAAPEEAGAADPTGAYASDILPAADAPGMLMLAILYPNGDAQVSSFYLNGEPPIIEFGSWEAGSSETITVTATRSLERDYDEPTSAVFTVTAEGLVAGDVTLHRVRAAGEAGAAEETVPAPVAMFQTEVMPAASSPGLQISLTLYDDSSAELASDYMNDDAPFVDVGTWAEGEDGALVLTLTGSADAPSDTPVEIVFDVQDDGTLVAVEYPQEIFGEAGLTLAPLPLEDTGETDAGTDASTSDAASDAAADGTRAGGLVFQSGTLPAASGGGREITLSLLDDGSAIMSTDFMNDEPPVTELGQWVQNDDGNLTLTLTEGPSGVYGAPVEITFAVNDDGSISAVEYDESVFGAEGLELAPVSSE